MALSPADFAAYSRATGTPYPEEPEERAALAPAVRDFRQNQLRNQESGPDFGGLAGLAAVGLGALGILAATRRGARGAQGFQPAQKVNTAKGDAAVRQLARQQPAPSKVVAPPSAIPQATIDLTTIQEAQLPQVRGQQVEASDAGLDQVIQKRVVIPEQREVTNFVTFSRDADRIARTAQVAEQISQFPQEVARIAATTPKAVVTTPKSVVTGNVWELEEQLEELGRQAQEFYGARYERGGRTLADLTGELEVSPKLAGQLKRSGIELRGGSSTARAMPQASEEARPLGKKQGSFPGTQGSSEGGTVYYTSEGIGRSVPLRQFSDAAASTGAGYNRFTPDELLERTMAAASYPREIRNQILNPEVSREQIREFLGSTPKVRGGAVSINPTMEIAGGARASMTDANVDELQTAGVGGSGLTYSETANLKQLGQKERLEQAGFTYDPNTGNYYQEIDDVDIDPTEVMTANREMGTDYGDTEGVGNLLIESESFRERTNEGTTQIPGVVQQAAAAAPGSERQLRSADVVVPLRRDAEGVQTTGLRVAEADPTKSFGQLLRMQDTGYKGGMGIETADINVGTNKLTGGFETAVDVVPDKITTQPISDWAPSVILGETIRGTNIRQPYKPTSSRIITGEAPLVGIRRAPLLQEGKRVGWTTLKNAKPEPVSLDRATIQSVAAQAQSEYFNNPSAKAAYLRERNPEALELGLAQGKTLSDIGEAYDYQGFIIKSVDDYLMNQEGIDLPVLKPQISKTTGNPYFSAEANAFVMGLIKTEKDTPIYGERIKLNPKGQKVIKGFNAGGYPIYETTGKSAPVPGQYQVRGEGGIDPMTIGDDYDGENVAYYAPRIDTASQTKVLREGQRLGVPAASMVGAVSTPIGVLASPLVAGTPTGAQMGQLRGAMSTPQAGVGMRSVPVRNPATGQRTGTERVSTMNIGSFARTQNPYTGPAAPAMGPASRVLSGNYQYSDPQLEVNLEPTSTRQQQERNQFAYTANLTPGGQVVRGTQQLGMGLGEVPAGVGSLTESETVARYGASGSQLKQFGNRLMSQAASRRREQSAPAVGVESVPDPIQERNDAIARHMGNYISAASQRLEGPASIAGVKLKGVGQNALRPYQQPSEGMIQQLIRASRG
jgi:hypothetical protein